MRWQVSAGQFCNCAVLSFWCVAIVKSLHVVSHYCTFEASPSRHRLCAETERPQIFCNTIFVTYWNMQTRNISILTPANHIVVMFGYSVVIRRWGKSAVQFWSYVLFLAHPTITSSTCGPCTLGCSPTDIWFIVAHQNTLCNTFRFWCMNYVHKFWL